MASENGQTPEPRAFSNRMAVPMLKMLQEGPASTRAKIDARAPLDPRRLHRRKCYLAA